MLIDSVVQFCDEMYSSFGDKCGCENGQCNHPSGECSGSCYNCLYHIHFPDRAPENAKKEYDCVKMLYHYVCQYSFLYTTELLCAFDHEWDYIRVFHIIIFFLWGAVVAQTSWLLTICDKAKSSQHLFHIWGLM